jgi:hypothetical protein
MARSYHVDIARHVANADCKWMDNLLSHFDVPGVTRGKQGLPRRLTEDGIAHVVLVRRLSSVLGVRIGDAVTLASNLLSHTSSVAIDSGVDLRIDRSVFFAEVGDLVRHAAEAIEPARRGRPRVLPSPPQPTK